MSVSVSGSCSHTIDPVTHGNVYDSTFDLNITIPHFGTVFSLEIDRHAGPDGSSLHETVTLGAGSHAQTYEISFNGPPLNLPSSVSGGTAPHSLGFGSLGTQLASHSPASSAPQLPAPSSDDHSGGPSLHMNDGTLISLPHSWHH